MLLSSNRCSTSLCSANARSSRPCVLQAQIHTCRQLHKHPRLTATHAPSSSRGDRSVQRRSHAQSYVTAETAVTLREQPKQFKQLFEAAFEESVRLTEPEIVAKGRVIKAVVEALQRGSSNGGLQFGGVPISIDRVAVAGSVGKSVTVQGQFDVDLVAFLNLPAAAGISIDLENPDTALYKGTWFRHLQQQVPDLLGRELHGVSGLQLLSTPDLGRAAVKFTVRGGLPEFGEQFELDCDMVLAPNLAHGAGAAAAAEWGVVPKEGEAPPNFQERAMMEPLLRRAEAAAAAGEWHKVPSSYLRSAWLAEATTAGVQRQAASFAEFGLSGRLVTDTIRLLKAWVRQGLQPQDTGFNRIKGHILEDVVLIAAWRLLDKKHDSLRNGGGGYILDLLLEALQGVVNRTDAAESNTPVEWTTVRATEGFTYEGDYTTKQRLFDAASALAPTPLRGNLSNWDGQPATVVYRGPASGGNALHPSLHKTLQSEARVIKKVRIRLHHPLDPLNSATPDRRDSRKVWRKLRAEARQLRKQLENCTWQEILEESSLGPVFKG